jgi:glycerophosphoryl diester phosphodiesterase
MELFKQYPELTLDIELKEYPSQNENAFEICDRILKIVDDYGFTDRVVINSFSNELNEYVYKTYGKKYRQHVFYPINWLCGPATIDPYSYAYCACMFRTLYNDGINIASPVDVAEMDKLGVQSWAGAAVRDEKSVDKAIAAGVVLITTNNPDVVLDLLREKGYHK